MKLHNTLSRSIEEVKPLEPGKIKLYACGLTVYSQPHIGNWVSYIYWDILRRVLTASGYEVTHVQNITDVGHLTSDEDSGEDKMEKGAKAEGTTAWDVAKKYIAVAEQEAELLGLLKPHHMPRATDYIPQQIDFIEQLEAKGFTYVIDDNGVYFDTSKLDDYGKLAHLDFEGLKLGARVQDVGKKNPTDFALWKFSPKQQKRDMEWESPWGTGFPGWHLECSVLARELLGDQIDIHTGGVDHIPVHHTNEIAQTESVTDKPFSKLWMHANHIKVNGTKMSKSLGNIYTINDVKAKGHDIRAFKLLVLSKHYRTEGNFTWEVLQAAKNRLQDIQMLADMRFQTTEKVAAQEKDYFKVVSKQLLQSLQNDLNTPDALRIISEVVTTVEKTGGIESSQITDFTSFLETVDSLLGLNLLGDTDISSEVKALISKRAEARKAEDWQTSDELRKELESQNIGLNDLSNNQTRWYRII